jgi:hypothetical protein
MSDIDEQLSRAVQENQAPDETPEVHVTASEAAGYGNDTARPELIEPARMD